MPSQKSLTESLAAIFGGVKNLGALYFEKARLKTTEKITILLATVAYSAVIMALGLVCLVFISIGIGHLLATTLAPHLAYLIIAAFYLLIFILAVYFRRQLFVDPISRFMSRLLVEKPEEIREAEREEEKAAAQTKREVLKARIREIMIREGFTENGEETEMSDSLTDELTDEEHENID